MTVRIGSVDESKLHPQVARIEWIERPRLITRLSASVRLPVTLVAAPPGYGKSTLVTQWFTDADVPGPKAWVGLDPGDNDPTRLWAHVATALERIGCWSEPDAEAYVGSSPTAVLARVIPRVIDGLAAGPDQVTLVLDDCHVIRSTDCARSRCCTNCRAHRLCVRSRPICTSPATRSRHSPPAYTASWALTRGPKYLPSLVPAPCCDGGHSRPEFSPG